MIFVSNDIYYSLWRKYREEREERNNSNRTCLVYVQY